MMREIFNDVIMCKDITQCMEESENNRGIQKIATLREQTITVQYVRCLHCTKVFSTLLYNRLKNKLDRRQPPDQGGFRRSLQTPDHPATYMLLEQKMPRVTSQDVDRDGRLRKGVRYDTSQRTMESPWKIRSRSAVH